MNNITTMGYKLPHKEHWMLVDWVLGTHCNYRCSYCPTMLHDGSYPFRSLNKCCNMVDLVSHHYPQQKCVRFTGGEPTVWRDFPDLLRHCKSHNWTTTAVTNGSRNLAWWKEQLYYLDAIILTWHPERAEWNHLSKLLNMYQDRVLVHVMMSPQWWDQQVAVLDKLHARGVMAWPKVILDKTSPEWSNQPVDYTPEQWQIIKRHQPQNWDTRLERFHRGAMVDDCNRIIDINQMLELGLNRFQGWRCWAGIHSIAIKEDGGVWNASCRNIRLGDVDTGQLTPINEPSICQKTHCHCLSDLFIKRHK